MQENHKTALRLFGNQDHQNEEVREVNRNVLHQGLDSLGIIRDGCRQCPFMVKKVIQGKLSFQQNLKLSRDM